MSHLKATDLQQIAIFKRIGTMLGAELHNIDTLVQRRDVSVALADYVDVLAAEGGEVGKQIVEQIVDPELVNAQIVFGIQSMRRVCVSAMRDIGEVKKVAMNGAAGVIGTDALPMQTAPPPPEAPVEAQPDADELAEDLELTTEE